MLVKTPPMGWNSWNTFGENINEQLIMETADAMVSTGLKDAGYEYIVIDKELAEKAAAEAAAAEKAKAEKAEADAKAAAEAAAIAEKQEKLDASIMAQETLLAEIRDLLKNK